MLTLRRLFGSALTVAALAGLTPAAQAQTPYSFQTDGNTYTEDFSTISTWTGPGTAPAAVTGTGAGATPASRFGRVANGALTNLAAADVNAVNVTTNALFLAFPGGGSGVSKITTVTTGITQPAIGLLATGTAPSGRSTAFDVFFDFTNRNAGTLAYNWAQLTNSTGTRTGTLRVYGTTVTNPVAADFSQIGTDITVTNGVASNGNFSAALPGAFNGSATARVRFYFTSALDNAGGGTRPGIAVDDIVVTATALGGSPTFSAAASVSGLNSVQSVAGTPVSVTLNGSNLTATPLIASVTGPFQVSATSGGTYGSSATIGVSSGSPQTLFVRVNSATTGAVTGSISYSGGGLASAPTNTSLSGTVLDNEPTTQPTLTVSATTATTLTLNLAGGNGAKFIIIGRAGSAFQDQSGFQGSNQPADGTAYSPNAAFGLGATVGTAGVFAVSSGSGTSVTVTGLTGGTAYAFAAFSYNDDGGTTGAQNYLVAGIPVVSPGPLAANVVSATTDQPPGVSYTWSGPANGLYTTAANWTPARTTPAANDLIEIPAGSSINVDLAANETVGNFSITGSGIVTMTMTGAASRTIIINSPSAGTDFSIPAGATLRLRTTTTATGLNFTVNSGSTGTIGGTLDINGNSGTVLTNALFTGTGTVNILSGAAVTVGAFVTGGSVAGTGTTFQNGSTLTKNGGTTPTATFQPSSTLIWNIASSLGLSGRTYGNLVLDNFSNGGVTGGSLLTINNLTFNATGKTVGLNLTGGIVINGNLNVTAGTLNFTPASASALTFSSPTATVTSVSPITLSNVTLNKPNGATLELTDLIIGTSAVTLGTNTSLNIANSLTFTTAAGITAGANILTLLSTPSQTAYVVSTGTGTANATVQRAVSSTSSYTGVGYRHYAAPVTGSTVADLATGTFSPIVDPAFNTPTPPTYTNATYPNVFVFNPALVTVNTPLSFSKAYQSADATSDVLVNGKGYSVRKDASTVDFVGALSTGNKALTLTSDGSGGGLRGWNLLGNPYPSPLDWQLVRDASAIPAATVQATIYFYKPTSTTGGFYDFTSGLAGDDFNDIALGQGFFARKTTAAASATINVTNAMRTIGNGNNFERAAPVSAQPYVRLAITNTAAPTVQPKTVIYFDATATNGLDNFHDGLAVGRSNGDVPSILTLINGEEAGVNALNALPTAGMADVVVPVLVATPVAGTYTISADKFLELPTGTAVILEDAVNGRTQDLTQNGTYTFQSGASYAGQRFTIRFSTAGRVTGLSADLTANALNLYPNPATSSVRISAPANTTVRVFDAVGREVKTLRIDAAGTETTIALTGLKAGLYTVRAGAASQKLVIQ